MSIDSFSFQSQDLHPVNRASSPGDQVWDFVDADVNDVRDNSKIDDFAYQQDPKDTGEPGDPGAPPTPDEPVRNEADGEQDDLHPGPEEASERSTPKLLEAVCDGAVIPSSDGEGSAGLPGSPTDQVWDFADIDVHNDQDSEDLAFIDERQAKDPNDLLWDFVDVNVSQGVSEQAIQDLEAVKDSIPPFSITDDVFA